MNTIGKTNFIRRIVRFKSDDEEEPKQTQLQGGKILKKKIRNFNQPDE